MRKLFIFVILLLFAGNAFGVKKIDASLYESNTNVISNAIHTPDKRVVYEYTIDLDDLDAIRMYWYKGNIMRNLNIENFRSARNLVIYVTGGSNLPSGGATLRLAVALRKE